MRSCFQCRVVPRSLVSSAVRTQMLNSGSMQNSEARSQVSTGDANEQQRYEGHHPADVLDCTAQPLSVLQPGTGE